jgi:hypothetical protein
MGSTTLRRLLVVAAVAAPLMALAGAACTLPGPDLSVMRSSNTSVYADSPQTVSLTVTNQGTGSAPEVTVAYSPGKPVVVPVTPGFSCAPVLQGHSGRGGGYTRVGWTCTQSPAVALAAGASEVVQFAVTYPVGTTTETWTVGTGSTTELNLVSHVTTTAVAATYPPVPSAPTGVAAAQSGDDLDVSWQPPAVAAGAVTSSTVTATPVGSSAPTLTTTVAGAATTAAIVGVQPATTYDVTVHSSDVAGAGAESDPATITTQPATVPPDAPSSVQGSLTGDTTLDLDVSWTASVPGNSPVDDYQVAASGSDGEQLTLDVGTSTSVVTSVSAASDSWTVTVRAHNAAGWSAWSSPIVVSAA